MLYDLVRSRRLSANSAITAWQGPFGADQDFITSNAAIEVKTVRDDLSEISISSTEQLNTERIPEIRLIVVRYRNVATEDPTAVTIDGLISKIFDFCKSDPIATREFSGALLEAGFVNNETYSDIAIAIVRKDAFDIAEGFPRLMPSTVDKGIIAATYHISLPLIEAFKLASYPYGHN